MTIDLGDVSAAAPSGPRPARRSATRHRPPALVAVLLILLGLGGSAVPPPQVEAVLVTEELPGGFRLSRSALFTTGYVEARGQVRRYPLTGTSTAWTTGLLQPVGDVALVEAARVLVVTSPESLQVSFLDSETGDVLWRRTTGATAVLRTTDDSALMTSPAGTGGEVVVERVGLRTGATVWSRKLTAVSFLHAGGLTGRGPSPIVTVDRRGRAAVLDFADGRVLRTAELGVGSELARYGDRLYLTRGQGGAGSLTAYRVSDLRRLWQSTTSSFGWPSDCGPYLCLSTATGMTVVDAATGDEGWSSTQWRLGVDSRAAGIPGPFRLVVSDARHTLRDALLDPATGQVVTELGDTILIGPVVVRVDTARSGRVWIQRFGARGDVRTVGSLEGESLERCAAEGEHLACVTRRGRATVWRVADDR